MKEKHIEYGPDYPKKRLIRLQMDDYICTKCGKTRFETRLEVHHKAYVKVPGKIGFRNDPEKDLKTLCESCHIVVTRKARLERELY